MIDIPWEVAPDDKCADTIRLNAWHRFFSSSIDQCKFRVTMRMRGAMIPTLCFLIKRLGELRDRTFVIDVERSHIPRGVWYWHGG